MKAILLGAIALICEGIFGGAVEGMFDAFSIVKIMLGVFMLRTGFTDEDIYEDIESNNMKNRIMGRIDQIAFIIGGIVFILMGLKDIFS